MKLTSVIAKSAREQWRHFWILVLTVSMAPFFIFVYYLIIGASTPHYDLLVINRDRGLQTAAARQSHGQTLADYLQYSKTDSLGFPVSVQAIQDSAAAMTLLKDRKADACIVIPPNFSDYVEELTLAAPAQPLEIEFIGDLTNLNYMVTAIWANELVAEFLYHYNRQARVLQVKETSLGVSGSISEFDLVVPGLLILALIMLMFPASIAIVTEVENKTMLRLKLSRLTALEFLAGISVIQVVVGLVAILLTLLVAVMLGFHFTGSLFPLLLIAVLTSISIIAFSLILAALTKTVNEILIVGNFPMFLFMFFTGAAFPMQGREWFSIAGYPVSLQGLMSPTHAIRALNKVMIMNLQLGDVVPEICALLILTVIYFIVGVWLFQRRHMRVE
ncbi:MAG TPA: ABC transporter permease [bacterium]|nr:ABC transporter permease [bacterium]HPN46214.1 ABC transporter permease [bacterium]